MKYLCLALVLAALGGFWYASAISQPPEVSSAPAVVPNVPDGAQVITLGEDCFWRTEAIYRQIPGVLFVTVGYMGGKTNQAEVARIVFNPAQTSLEKILQVFWASHHPTQSNSGSGRSVIFYYTPDQHAMVEKSVAEATKSFSQPILTQVAPAAEFYAAEEFHQNYYGKGRGQCSIATSPQLQALGIK
jgi:peptide-methionine (S)-S-oxide reductase